MLVGDCRELVLSTDSRLRNPERGCDDGRSFDASRDMGGDDVGEEERDRRPMLRVGGEMSGESFERWAEGL
jgi:hypothetical protein